MEDWIAGLIGALVGSTLTFIASYLMLRFNYRQLFAQTVSQSRNCWLNKMRENIAIMLAEGRKNACSYKSKEFYVAKNEVLLRLNTSEPLHLMLFHEIEKIEQAKDENLYNQYEENIIKIYEELLKREWERVKKEAKGER